MTLSPPDENGVNENETTLASYDGRVAAYLAADGGDPSRAAQLLSEECAPQARTDAVPAGPWGGILANAVLLHVPRPDLPGVLVRLRAAVAPGTSFALSLKSGREDGWSHAKLGAPRWFVYWDEPDVREVLETARWRVSRLERREGDPAWLVIVARAC